MPFQPKTVMDQKLELIQMSKAGSISFSELCRRLEITRKTGYKWLKRYQECGESGLDERSRRPKTSPHRLCSKLESIILEIRDNDPEWGEKRFGGF